MSKSKILAALSLAALSFAARADGGSVGVYVSASAAAPGAGLTRAQVQAERDAALARGELHRFGEAGPSAEAQPSMRTRAEVRAELLEAIRLGVHGSGGEAGPPIATPAQEAQIAAAGRAAAKRLAAMQ
ncbi:MAG: hypothetical protein ACOY5V_03900 [Pseudomonadota bacterium]